jgi:hypothetical protein
MWVSSYPYHTQRGRKGTSDIKVCRCEHCEAHIPEDGHCRQKATEPDGQCLPCHKRAAVSFALTQPK